MTFSDAIFWVSAATAALSAVCLLLSRSIVRMAFLLLACLAGVAGLYLQLGAGFLGFTQVVVYIGGILILLLFGVMLTARADIPVRQRAGVGFVLPGLLAGLGALALLVFLSDGGGWIARTPAPEVMKAPDAPQIALKLLGKYILPFEAVSILLLTAMVGATYIARSHAEGPGEGPEAGDTAPAGPAGGAQ